MVFGKKPIMSPALEAQVMNAVVQFSKKKEWIKWGMHKMRKQGAAILLIGPPGTGKTVIAEYIALKIRRKGIKELSFADFGSQVPGENSRQIRRIFAEAKKNGLMTVFLDECDAILWDRGKADGSSMWMLEVINELLVQIGNYEGCTILASNFYKVLDPALQRRLLAIIKVGMPEKPERVRLWQAKLPDEFPLKLSINDLDNIATLQLSGSEIETAILDYASDCLRSNKKPSYNGIYEAANDILARREEYAAQTSSN